MDIRESVLLNEGIVFRRVFCRYFLCVGLNACFYIYAQNFQLLVEV